MEYSRDPRWRLFGSQDTFPPLGGVIMSSCEPKRKQFSRTMRPPSFIALKLWMGAGGEAESHPFPSPSIGLTFSNFSVMFTPAFPGRSFLCGRSTYAVRTYASAYCHRLSDLSLVRVPESRITRGSGFLGGGEAYSGGGV